MAVRPTDPELRHAYRDLGGIERVADRYDVAFETARRWLRDAGAPLRPKGRPSTSAATLPINELKRRYLAGESIAQIGRAYSVSPATIRTRLRKAGVELRPRPGWKY